MENLNVQVDEAGTKPDEIKPDTPTSTDGQILTGGLPPFYNNQQQVLQTLAKKIFLALGLFIIISGILLGFTNELGITLIWACIIAGVLGSTSSALISALERKAKGWEFEDGKKYPKDSKKLSDDDKRDMFSQRMATFFLYRPAFGIIGGLLIYFGMQAKYFGDTGTEDESKVIFWSLLSGLFIKSLIEKLKDLFDSFVGKK